MIGTATSMLMMLSPAHTEAAPTGPKCFVIANNTGMAIAIDNRPARRVNFVQPNASWRAYGGCSRPLIAEPITSTLTIGAA
jgi:hypothetical protein